MIRTGCRLSRVAIGLGQFWTRRISLSLFLCVFANEKNTMDSSVPWKEDAKLALEKERHAFYVIPQASREFERIRTFWTRLNRFRWLLLDHSKGFFRFFFFQVLHYFKNNDRCFDNILLFIKLYIYIKNCFELKTIVISFELLFKWNVDKKSQFFPRFLPIFLFSTNFITHIFVVSLIITLFTLVKMFIKRAS